VSPYDMDFGFSREFLRFPPKHALIGELKARNVVNLTDLSLSFKQLRPEQKRNLVELNADKYLCPGSASVHVCPAVMWLLPLSKVCEIGFCFGY
jgi:hypothetical protein